MHDSGPYLNSKLCIAQSTGIVCCSNSVSRQMNNITSTVKLDEKLTNNGNISCAFQHRRG